MYKGYAISLILMVFLISSCASPQKSFNKGDYDKAYKSALKILKKGKKSRKDLTTLNKSFEQILNREQGKIADYNRSDVIEDWEEAYGLYDGLLDKYEEGKNYLDNDFDATMDIVYEEQERLRLDIGDSYFNLGELQLEAYAESGNKLAAQEAYYLYTKAAEYGHTDPLLSERQAYAQTEGVITVLVIAEERWGISFAYDIDREFSRVERRSQDFKEVLYERRVDADCTIEIEFSDLDRRVRDNRSNQTYREEVQDGFETRQDTSGTTTQVPRYVTVSAQVTTIREEISFEWTARARIFGDRDYCREYRERTFRAEEVLVNEIYEIRGDTRAVPREFQDSRYDNRREEEIIRELIEELYDDFERAYF